MNHSSLSHYHSTERLTSDNHGHQILHQFNCNNRFRLNETKMASNFNVGMVYRWKAGYNCTACPLMYFRVNDMAWQCRSYPGCETPNSPTDQVSFEQFFD